MYGSGGANMGYGPEGRMISGKFSFKFLEGTWESWTQDLGEEKSIIFFHLSLNWFLKIRLQ